MQRCVSTNIPQQGWNLRRRIDLCVRWGALGRRDLWQKTFIRRIHLRFLGSGHYYWLNPEGKEGRNRKICVKSLVDLS